MRAYSTDLRVRVLAAIDAGDPTGEVAEVFAVSPAWVRRLVQRRRETGETTPRKARDPRVPKLREHLPRIREFLAATPDLTLAELRHRLRVTVALSTLWAAVRPLGLTLKKAPGRPSRTGPTCGPPGTPGGRRPHQLPTRTGWCSSMRPGRIPRWTGGTGTPGGGEPVVGAVTHGHYKSLTLTAALRADRVTATQVLDGPMTGDRFREYVTAVLVPTLRPGDVVVMDNLRCHKAAGVREAVEAVGCVLRFLPPYSPDLNPIELAFAKLKRGRRTDGHRAIPTLVNFLESARAAYRPEECAAYIRHCGYGLPPATTPPNRH